MPFNELWNVLSTRAPAATRLLRDAACSAARCALTTLFSWRVSLRPAVSCTLATESPAKITTTFTTVWSRARAVMFVDIVPSMGTRVNRDPAWAESVWSARMPVTIKPAPTTINENLRARLTACVMTHHPFYRIRRRLTTLTHSESQPSEVDRPLRGRRLCPAPHDTAMAFSAGCRMVCCPVTHDPFDVRRPDPHR